MDKEEAEDKLITGAIVAKDQVSRLCIHYILNTENALVAEDFEILSPVAIIGLLHACLFVE